MGVLPKLASDHLAISTIVNATGRCRPMPRCLTGSQPGETGIELGVRTLVVGHSRSRQAALRGNKAVDPPPRPLMPTDVEGGQFWEELELAIRQVVMDPPGDCTPIRTVM